MEISNDAIFTITRKTFCFYLAGTGFSYQEKSVYHWKFQHARYQGTALTRIITQLNLETIDQVRTQWWVGGGRLSQCVRLCIGKWMTLQNVRTVRRRMREGEGGGRSGISTKMGHILWMALYAHFEPQDDGNNNHFLAHF